VGYEAEASALGNFVAHNIKIRLNKYRIVDPIALSMKRGLAFNGTLRSSDQNRIRRLDYHRLGEQRFYTAYRLDCSLAELRQSVIYLI
jgi:hypothetical protein